MDNNINIKKQESSKSDLDNFKSKFDEGDNLIIIAALRFCIARNMDIPKWLGDAFITITNKVIYDYKELSDVFGLVHKRKHIERDKFKREVFYQVHTFISTLNDDLDIRGNRKRKSHLKGSELIETIRDEINLDNHFIDIKGNRRLRRKHLNEHYVPITKNSEIFKLAGEKFNISAGRAKEYYYEAEKMFEEILGNKKKDKK